MKTGTVVSVRCDKCNSILINGTINLINTRIQDATCDTCMIVEAEELSQSDENELIITQGDKILKEMIDDEVLSLEESKDILDNCKSDMKRIHVIADIFK